MYLLDTNVVSALRRMERLEPHARAWLTATPDLQMYVSSVTVMELQYGALLRRHRDRAQGDVFVDWIARFVLPTFAGRIIAFDAGMAMRCAELHVPDQRPEHDAMIAATALEHRLTVVTRNVRDFGQMGVPIVNPWDHDAQ